MHQIRGVLRALQHALRKLVRTLVESSRSWTSATRFSCVYLSFSARLTAVRIECRRLARIAPDVGTQIHCFENCIDYMSRSDSRSGCVFWHTIVCTTQHRRISQTASADIGAQRLDCCSSPSTLCRLPDVAGAVNHQLLVSVRFLWQQHERGTVVGCLVDHYWRQTKFHFSISHLSDKK